MNPSSEYTEAEKADLVATWSKLARRPVTFEEALDMDRTFAGSAGDPSLGREPARADEEENPGSEETGVR